MGFSYRLWASHVSSYFDSALAAGVSIQAKETRPILIGLSSLERSPTETRIVVDGHKHGI